MKVRANFGWWVYTTATLILGYGQMIRKISADSGGFTSRYGPAFAATMLAVGVIALLLQKPLFRQWFWKIVFGIFVLASSVGFGFGLYLLFVQDVPDWLILLLVGGAVYLIPGEIQLYRYAFRSGALWHSKSVAGGV